MTRPTRPDLRYVDRLIVGTPAEVGQVIRSMMERGRLLAVTVPHPIAGGRVAVKARLAAPVPTVRTGTGVGATPARAACRSVPAGRVGWVAAGAAGAVAATAGLGYVAYLLISAMWPLLLAVAVVLFWLRRTLSRASPRR